MLVEVWKHSLHVGMVKIPSNNENAFWLYGLHVTDGLVENTQGLFGADTGRVLDGSNCVAGKFPVYTV